MTRTALALSPEEWRAYHPGLQLDEDAVRVRWEQAWKVARRAAQMLRERFGATRVVAFGSLTQGAWFTVWSDIDLAAWGIPPDTFYRAVAWVTGLSSEFEIDLVAMEDCRAALRQAILDEGIDL